MNQAEQRRPTSAASRSAGAAPASLDTGPGQLNWEHLTASQAHNSTTLKDTCTSEEISGSTWMRWTNQEWEADRLQVLLLQRSVSSGPVVLEPFCPRPVHPKT